MGLLAAAIVGPIEDSLLVLDASSGVASPFSASLALPQID